MLKENLIVKRPLDNRPILWIRKKYHTHLRGITLLFFFSRLMVMIEPIYPFFVQYYILLYIN